MSLDVKLTLGNDPPVRVSFEAIERMTGLKHPWVQQTNDGSQATYYGLCPECENAMRLVNPFETLKITPHGRHVVEHVPGFAYDLDRIKDCSRFKGATRSGLLNDGEDAIITPNGRQVRTVVTENADILLGVLVEDIGFSPSRNLVRTLFRTFFGTLLYLRPDITSGNAPWLLFGTLRTYPLYGQIMRRNSDITKAILRKVRGARIGRWSRLKAQPGQWIDIRFSLQQHRMSGADPPCETILLVVSMHQKEDQVSTLLEKTVDINPEKFLRRIHDREPPTDKGRVYIDIARAELDRHISERPALQ